MNLRIPGPTPLPPDVLQAVGQQMISHRAVAFEAMFAEVVENCKVFFETEGDLFVMTSSGTGGMETAIVNTLSPGDRVLAVSCGVFGDRFTKIAKAYGADVQALSFPLGQPVDPAAVETTLREDGPFSAVLVTQNETSAGVTNDIETLSRVIHAADPAPLMLVDAISGLGAIRCQADAWGVDVLISGSQKAWMAPPGLAMLSFNDRAWAAYEKARMPRYYFDLGSAKKYGDKHQTPATPNVAALYGLQYSLRRMVDEGLQACAERHQHIGAYCRQGMLDIGMGLFAAEGYYSNTVTAVTLPEGFGSKAVLSKLQSDYDIYCGSSKAPDVEMIRVGHMGYVCERDLDEVFQALAEITG